MNFEYFIAKRIISANEYTNSISSPIIKIAILSIVIGFIFVFFVKSTGIFMRILGNNLLNIKKNNQNTYYIKKDNKNNSMKNQF